MSDEKDDEFWGELTGDLNAIGGGRKKNLTFGDNPITIELLVNQIEGLVKEEPELAKAISLLIFKLNILTMENKTLRHVNQRIESLVKGNE